MHDQPENHQWDVWEGGVGSRTDQDRRSSFYSGCDGLLSLQRQLMQEPIPHLQSCQSWQSLSLLCSLSVPVKLGVLCVVWNHSCSAWWNTSLRVFVKRLGTLHLPLHEGPTRWKRSGCIILGNLQAFNSFPAQTTLLEAELWLYSQRLTEPVSSCSMHAVHC